MHNQADLSQSTVNGTVSTKPRNQISDANPCMEQDELYCMVDFETKSSLLVLLLGLALYGIRQAGHGGNLPETIPGE